MVGNVLYPPCLPNFHRVLSVTLTVSRTHRTYYTSETSPTIQSSHLNFLHIPNLYVYFIRIRLNPFSLFPRFLSS